MSAIALEYESSSLRNYVGAADILAGFMRIAKGAELSDSTKDKWVNLMWAMRIADDFIDNELASDSRTRVYDYVLDALGNRGLYSRIGGKIDEVIGVIEGGIMYDFSKDRRDIFVTNLRLLFKVTESLKTERNPHKLADLTRLEGQLTARMLLLTLPEEDIDRKSHIIVTRFCRFANNVDSAVDMPRDYRKREIECNPTIRNMAIMLLTALPDITSAVMYLKPGLNEMLQMIDFGLRTIEGLNRA